MGRCHFVQPERVRLYLVDVHRRAHADLLKKGVEVDRKAKTYRPATIAEVKASEARVAAAEADGDWIDVKKRLNAGEQRHIFGRLVKTMHFGEQAEVDPEQVGRCKLAEYILDWSFVDMDGHPVKFDESALDSLQSDTYADLVAAIDAHEAAEEEARDAEKNERGTARVSSPI